MRFVMFSKCGEGAGLLYKIKEEGDDVALYIKESDYHDVYDGMLDKIELWDIQDTDLILFDSSGMGDKADYYKKRGNLVFGGSLFHDKLENDREFGLNTMLSCDMMIPETHYFDKSDWKEAEKFISQTKDKYVFKPSGELPSRLTYCSSDSEDLIEYMKFVREYYGKEVESFVLQKFIGGTLSSTEGWFDGSKFSGFNHTVEVKKFMDNDKGPSTGCSGNIVWVSDEDSPLVENLKKVEDVLAFENYVGPIDINVIFNESGIYGLEWTPRFGLDAMPTLLQLVDDGGIAKVIHDFCSGSGSLSLRDKFAGGVRVTIPPYPIEPQSAKSIQKISPNLGIPVRGIDEELLSKYYFFEVMKKKDKIVHSSGTGVICVISDSADEIDKCLELPYELADELKIPDKQYRTDLCEVLPKMYDKVMENSECLI